MITKFDVGQYVYYDCYSDSLNNLIIKEGTIIAIHIDREGITYSINWNLKNESHYVKCSGSSGVPETYLYLDKQDILKKYDVSSYDGKAVEVDGKKYILKELRQ